ncbi:hypothetical protein [Streptomyces noursei]|uniref:hypothetical protein n=1 Tax=Streptomyces noursei TaxID=1971 RepID=UPI0023B85988|nr:hypothetical protein [Streptomyces noursei]
MPTPESGGWEELLSAMVGFGAPAESDTRREFARVAGTAAQADPVRSAPPHSPHAPPRPAAVHTNVLDGAAHLQGQRVQARDIQGGVHLHHQATPTVPRPGNFPRYVHGWWAGKSTCGRGTGFAPTGAAGPAPWWL